MKRALTITFLSTLFLMTGCMKDVDIFALAQEQPTGIRVTFGNYNWTAGYYGIFNYIPEGYNAMVINAYESQYSRFPNVLIAATPSLGTHTETAQNGYMSGYPFHYVEYYENTSLFSESNGDTTWYGDWWAKTATINTTKFDATAGIVTTVVNANMFSALEAFVDPGVGIDAAATKNLSVNCNNVELISDKRSAVHVKRKAYKFSAK